MDRQVNSAAAAFLSLAEFITPITPVESATQLAVESASVSSTLRLELTMIAPEQLTCAVFAPPSTIELEFADGLRSPLPIERLGMPVDRIDWPTLKASPTGEKIVVKGVKGDAIPIDAAHVRYLVDEEYAARTDSSFQVWDRQIKEDSASGGLDWLIDEVSRDLKANLDTEI